MKQAVCIAILTALSVVPGRAAPALTPDEANTIAALQRVQPSTVLITVDGVEVDEDGRGIVQSRVSGSGFAVAPGRIVTNYHVIASARRITVSPPSGPEVDAWIVGTAPGYDLAVLGVPLGGKALPPAPLGDSRSLAIGQKVLAVSNPFGLEHSVSQGIVSGLKRTLPGLELGPRIIQFDAPINPGQSGGPLVDSSGAVVGITTAKVIGAEAIGFAVPVSVLRRAITDLEAMGHIFRPPLGFAGTAVDADLARLFRLPIGWGVLVERVEPGSAAERAGLAGGDRHVTLGGRELTLGGDIIVGFDETTVDGPTELNELLLESRPGEEVTLSVIGADGPRKVKFVVPSMQH